LKIIKNSLAIYITIILFIFFLRNQTLAWATLGHKTITTIAFQILTQKVDKSNILLKNEKKITNTVMTPDIRKETDSSEEKKHYINLEYYFDYGFSIKSFPWKLEKIQRLISNEKIDKFGRAPWGIQDTFSELVIALKKKDAQLIIEKAANLAHYVGDIHQPLHTTRNFNGQETGNSGIHKRFEEDLLDLYKLQIYVKIPNEYKLKIISNINTFTFQELKKTYSYLPQILQADRKAVWEPGIYDNKYYQKFWENTKSIINQSLLDAGYALSLYYYNAIILSER